MHDAKKYPFTDEYKSMHPMRLTGVLNACPMNDPHFLECLYEYHVTDEHLRCLSKCFKPEAEPPTCGEDAVYSSTHRKRHAARIIARDGLVDGNVSKWEKVTFKYPQLDFTSLTVITGKRFAIPCFLQWIFRSHRHP